MGFGIARAGHDKDTLPLNTVEILRPWTLQGYRGVGHCRDTLLWGTAEILCSWALQEYLGIARILSGWALQGYVAVKHCTQAGRGGWGQQRLPKSNNPTVRVGHKP